MNRFAITLASATALAAAFIATAPVGAHADQSPNKPIDISVALECRIVRSWVGHPWEIRAETAVSDYEEERALIDAIKNNASATNADRTEAEAKFDAWEEVAKLHDYHNKILVAYNHGVSDAATIADPFYRTLIVDATDNSITTASVPHGENEDYLGHISGTIDRRSGHGKIYEYKTHYDVKESGDIHKDTRIDTLDIVECTAAQPARF